MHLYLVRHGQSTTNRLTAQSPRSADGLAFSRPDSSPAFVGRQIDPELTELGLRQAELTADRLKRERLTDLYCSPLVRALQTAQVLGSALSLRPRVWVSLTEHRGLEGFRGLSRREAERLFPHCALPEEMGEQGWWNGEMEPADALWRRAGSAVSALLRIHGGTDARVAVVAHGTFTSRFIAHLLECPDVDYCRFLLGNCSVTLLTLSEGQVRLHYANDMTHLPEDLRS